LSIIGQKNLNYEIKGFLWK